MILNAYQLQDSVIALLQHYTDLSAWEEYISVQSHHNWAARVLTKKQKESTPILTASTLAIFLLHNQSQNPFNCFTKPLMVLVQPVYQICFCPMSRHEPSGSSGGGISIKSQRVNCANKVQIKSDWVGCLSCLNINIKTIQNIFFKWEFDLRTFLGNRMLDDQKFVLEEIWKFFALHCEPKC